MEYWKLVTVAVAIFAFSLEIRPMDSFLTTYMTSPNINIPLSEVSDVLTPIRIYFGVIGTFLVFMLADYLQYKPVMVFNGIMGILTYVNLMNSPTLFSLKIAEVCLSLFLCAEVSYYGYLYAKIGDKKHYQIATGYTKAGVLGGICVSGLLGQLVVYLNNGNCSTLPYYSLAGMTFATVWACILPSVEHNKYIHLEDIGTTGKTKMFSKSVIYDPIVHKYSTENVHLENVVHKTVAKTNSFGRIYEDFKRSYTDFTVFQWSCWHVICLAGYTQIILYINILYTYIVNISNDKTMMYNGLVDSLANICAAYCAYNIGKVNVDWTRYGNTFLSISSLTLGLTMCACYFSKNIVFIYIVFICYNTLVQSVFVIVISQIAKRLKHDCYTLVLGFNSFLGVLLSMCSSVILTYIETSIPGKFLFYGATYVVLGIIYGSYIVFKKIISKNYNQLP